MLRLLHIAAILFTATAAAASPPSIRVETDVQEKYYDVVGTNADEVFTSIQAKGLGGKAGLSASGLTDSEMAYTMSTSTSPTECRLTEVALHAKVTVTLPRHARPGDLDATTRRYWEAYESQVEFHEYRHVEIEFQGVQELQARLERETVHVSGGSTHECSRFVEQAISEQTETTKRRHEEFHRRESAAVRAEQASLLAQIASHGARLGSEKAELERLSRELESLSAERARLANAIDGLLLQHGRELPSREFDDAQEINAAIEILTEEMNETAAIRNSLVDRYNEAIEERRYLSTRLTWTR